MILNLFRKKILSAKFKKRYLILNLVSTPLFMPKKILFIIKKKINSETVLLVDKITSLYSSNFLLLENNQKKCFNLEKKILGIFLSDTFFCFLKIKFF